VIIAGSGTTEIVPSMIVGSMSFPTESKYFVCPLIVLPRLKAQVAGLEKPVVSSVTVVSFVVVPAPKLTVPEEVDVVQLAN
jgi:hypothetical protein